MHQPDKFTDALKSRILILDGGFGTMLQTYDVPHTSHPDDACGCCSGCNDLLSVAHPDIVADIHRRYLRAGADIISTNSFNANAISLADYNLQDRAYEISLAAATVARACADEFGSADRPRFVAGSMGPTNRTLSMSARVEEPGAREVTFDRMLQAYLPQARGLIDGGVDVVLVETVFDTLNAKAALAAVRSVSPDIPVIVSATVSDASGRTLTGQTIEAFCASVMHSHPVALGLNCGFGARHMLPYLRELAGKAEVAVSVHPNAGLPNVDGGYDETPQMFARDIEEYLREGLVNIVGGCCGTTPAHIARIAPLALKYGPRRIPAHKAECVVCGLEPLHITTETNFINIGERTNVAGSAKFARLIREGSFDEALEIARAQVQAGAQVVDVCMDAALIDAPKAMQDFLNLMASDPTVARVPVMIDSSDFSVIEAGLKCTQGKSIVNSISLKEGVEKFLEHARTILRYGAAVVVMLFDEQGQADTYERKIQVAGRAYRLLTSAGFPAEDIIFDPNVLAVATGMPEHDRYALDFIRATGWIKQNLPGAKVSGGVSNLSFAFRGNNTVRKAMHSVFLYHAIHQGMDMAIVNPQMVVMYDDIPHELLCRVEDVVLYRRADASDRLIDYAREISADAEAAPAASAPDNRWRELPVGERIMHAMLSGDTQYIAADALEAYHDCGDAVKVIDTQLMPAMTRVGQLFGEGKLFLPQVVKSARVMKLAVAAIEPYFPKHTSGGSDAKKVVLATVKGDVHDIGKNIVGVVLACNGFEVIDLGVMVDAERIIRTAVAEQAVAICLSGLITPSLGEMAAVASLAQRQGCRIPIVVGGATTSAMHTAVKLAPLYDSAVIHSTDAADNASIVASLASARKAGYLEQVRELQQELRSRHDATPPSSLNTMAAKTAVPKEVHTPAETTPAEITPVSAKIAEVADRINWTQFFAAWGLRGGYPAIFSHPERGAAARELYDDAQRMLSILDADNLVEIKGVIGKFPAHSEADDVVITLADGTELVLPMLRSEDTSECVADKVGPSVQLFAITAGLGLSRLCERYRADNDEYSAMLAKTLCDRLVEATADKVLGDDGRFAIGYPSIPDHSLKREVFKALDVEALAGMTLTHSCMIVPAEAICGMMLPGERYFTLGSISEARLADYARRRRMSVDDARRYIQGM